MAAKPPKPKKVRAVPTGNRRKKGETRVSAGGRVLFSSAARNSLRRAVATHRQRLH